MGHISSSLFGNYFCEHLDPDISKPFAITPVSTDSAGLANYLLHHAVRDEQTGAMRTYLVRDTKGDLVGYFSLKAGLVSINEKLNGKNLEFDTVPGVELANFALDASYRAKHPASKGCGKVLFNDLVLPIVANVSKQVGVSLLYLFSIPNEKVINNYRQYGFERLQEQEEQLLHSRLKPRYDENCIFMYMVL